MHNRWKKGLAVLLSMILLCGMLPVSAFAAGTVVISSKEDFLRFAKKCTLDSWSEGKIVELQCDIDLKHTSGTVVPIFSGTFRGNGHTISGVQLKQDGSNLGLFRYVGETGLVQGLRVEGSITPGGSRGTIGGIVGENNGTIENCTFQGTVEGKTNVGGIAGSNTDTGEIRYCSVSGEINGELAVGGITGENKGFLLQCENHAVINGEYEETEQDLTGLDADAADLLENYKNQKEESERETLDRTDIGGIVGATEGILQGCKNYGDVGYPHRGYNVGGVAGRQSGYLLGCENHAAVYGRKDVGGIVGQAEPYLWLSSSGDILDDVRAELDTLGDMADRLLDDTDVIGTNAEAYLDSISNHADTAGDHAEEVKEQLKSFAKDNEAELDAWTAELSDTLDRMERPMDQLSDAMDSLSDAMDDLDSALSVLSKSMPKIDSLTQIRKEISNIRQAKKEIQTARTTINTSIKALGKAILEKDKETAKTEVAKIFSAMETIQTQQKEILSSLKEIRTLRKNLPEEIEDAADTLNRRWKKALDRLDDALDGFSDASSDIGKAMERIGDILSDFADAEPEFVKLGDDFEASSEALFDLLEFISDDMKGLRVVLQDGGDTLKTDLRNITDQFEKIVNLIFDEIDDIKNGDDEDVFLDVSDQEIRETRQGKIANSRNYGTVEGDRNAGGIAGAMSVDLAAAPEMDVEKPNTIRFTYRMKVILQDCVNEGNISGRKDCIGGVAGYGEIGTVYGCENYGNAESSGGDYVGGIIGKSTGTVRKCYAKGELNGGRYVGGIAGKAEGLTDCCAIVDVEGEENIGAILGGTQELEQVRRNYFVEQGQGAVDSISYAGKGEPVSYETMKTIEGIPSRFISFTVTFVAGDTVVETQDICYGEKTSAIKLPEIPEKKGCFGKWQAFAEDTVTGDLRVECEYIPYVTVVSSEEKNETGKLSLVLAEGTFTDAAELHAFAVTAENLPVQPLGKTVVYDVILEDDGTELPDTMKLRLLNEEKENVSIWQETADGWTELDTKDRGKYVVCEMQGTEGRLCLQYTPASSKLIFLLPIGVVAIGTAVVLVKKKKGKKEEA